MLLIIVKRYELLCERALYKCNLLLSLLTTADGCRCKEIEFAAHWFQCTKLKCLSWVLGPQEPPPPPPTPPPKWQGESESQNEEVLVGQRVPVYVCILLRKNCRFDRLSVLSVQWLSWSACPSSSDLGCCYFFLWLCKSIGATGSRCTETITWLLLSRLLLWDRGLITLHPEIIRCGWQTVKTQLLPIHLTPGQLLSQEFRTITNSSANCVWQEELSDSFIAKPKHG